MASQEELIYVEKVGRYFEQLTLPRMAGRIFGWLLISETPLVSANELVDVLQASKSSISSMTRLLIQIDLVELVSLPGDRRDYYRVAANAWASSLRARLAQAQAFRLLAEEGLALLAGSDPERRLRLEEMRGLYAMLEAEIPKLLERWQSEQKKLEA
ncbi:MAG TPA: MarR family transcriptional regulator [Anaerolineaceae bacterium]|nr:MarR family transcriptional regulator [Anaerolineaceae bacterium]